MVLTTILYFQAVPFFVCTQIY